MIDMTGSFTLESPSPDHCDWLVDKARLVLSPRSLKIVIRECVSGDSGGVCARELVDGRSALGNDPI